MPIFDGRKVSAGVVGLAVYIWAWGVVGAWAISFAAQLEHIGMIVLTFVSAMLVAALWLCTGLSHPPGYDKPEYIKLLERRFPRDFVDACTQGNYISAVHYFVQFCKHANTRPVNNTGYTVHLMQDQLVEILAVKYELNRVQLKEVFDLVSIPDKNWSKKSVDILTQRAIASAADNKNQEVMREICAVIEAAIAPRQYMFN